MHFFGYNWGMMLLGGLAMLLFWAVIIGLTIWVVRTVTRAGRGEGASEPLARRDSAAVDILKQRYARGEITREEYQAMLRELQD